jgi:hypothetical protein
VRISMKEAPLGLTPNSLFEFGGSAVHRGGGIPRGSRVPRPRSLSDLRAVPSRCDARSEKAEVTQN